MTRFLLDVNVLIALIDPEHLQHDRAHDWFTASGSHGWATCPLTENAVLRIVSHARYPNSRATPTDVAELLSIFCKKGGHEFWPGDITLLDPHRIDRARLLTSAQITDSYLLALACAHGGKLATFDRHVVTAAVVDGARALHCIG